MKKRPLAWLCLAVVIFLTLIGRTTGVKRTAALADLEEYLIRAAGNDAAGTFEATVAKTQAGSEGERLFLNQILIVTKDKSNDFLSSEIQFILTTKTENFLPGDRVRVTGTFRPFSSASNPGEFDTRAYYFNADTVGTVSDPVITLVASGNFSIKRLLTRIRRALRGSYLRILDEKTAGTVAAITLGERNLMDREMKLLYQEGGIAHMISVSGLHISLIGMCLYELLRRLCLPIPAAAGLSGAAVTGYALMTGFQIPAVRACLMFLIWLGAQILGRKRDMMTALSIAAVLILVRDPRQIRMSSFLLSFCAVLAIVLLVPRLQAAYPFPEKEKGAGRRIWGTLSTGAGVWIGTLPVTLWFFYQCAPWSILLNLAVIPLMSAVMAFGFLCGIAGIFSTALGTFLSAPVYYLLGLFEGLCRLQQVLPKALWVAGRPDLWKVVLYYALLVAAAAGTDALLRKRKRQKKSAKRGVPALLWICAAVCAVSLMGTRTRTDLSVINLDVGQGDGALAAFPDGTTVLIDGGSSSSTGVWEYRISQTLKYYGIHKLDYVFISHADSDHMNGVEEFLDGYLPGFAGENAHGISLKNLVLPPTADPEDFARLRDRAEELKIPVLQMEAGDRLTGTDQRWSLSCLAPKSGRLTGEKNEDSMVLLLEYGLFRMLFTGDLEGEKERSLAASGSDIACDVLKVGHHGSKNGSSAEFLAAVSPAFGILSCGKNNRYGHPAPEAVKRLQDAGVTLFSTMDCGALMIQSDGRQYSILGYQKTMPTKIQKK